MRELFLGPSPSRFTHFYPQPVVTHQNPDEAGNLIRPVRAYVECQGRASRAWSDVVGWTSASILNVARMGRFSSDRSIRDYVREVWHVRPVKLAPVR